MALISLTRCSFEMLWKGTDNTPSRSAIEGNADVWLSDDVAGGEHDFDCGECDEDGLHGGSNDDNEGSS